MKRKKQLLFFYLNILALFTAAQQLPQYAQFTLNNLAMNPAYGGTHLGLEVLAGRRNQWLGFDGAPVETFISAIYSWRKNYNYKAIHSVGGYVEQDKIGLFTYKSAHAYYAIHLKISRAWKMGFGMFAGARSVSISSGLYNKNDPAFNFVNPTVYLYPDFVPGWRLYSKKMFFDVSVRNLYKNKLKQGSKELGDNSKLIPQPVLIYGMRFHSPTNDFVFTPAVKLQGAVTQIPLVDLNCVAYYRKRIGLGLTYRVGNSVAAMLQVRIKSNIMLAFGYEYMVNRLRNYYPQTTEVLFGFSPVMGIDGERPTSTRIAACPEFDY
jgi:type IX secretion system PorP/SprF family membrane protein